MPGYGRRCASIFSVLFSSRNIELELVIFGIYGSCPKTLILFMCPSGTSFFFGPDLQLRKMRWSGAEGYAKGDVISNYHIQGPHIHLCTCWYKWHFVVTIGCTFVTVSTSPQPSTCSNVFRLSGFGLKDRIIWLSLRDDIFYYSHQENLTQYLNAKIGLGAGTTHL